MCLVTFTIAPQCRAAIYKYTTRGLSRWRVRQLPKRKYRKNRETCETCSICLEDFKEGENIRVLPCDHGEEILSPDPGLKLVSSPDPGLKLVSSPDPGLKLVSSPDPGLKLVSSPDPGLKLVSSPDLAGLKLVSSPESRPPLV